jgi:hypothetical protein
LVVLLRTGGKKSQIKGERCCFILVVVKKFEMYDGLWQKFLSW